MDGMRLDEAMTLEMQMALVPFCQVPHEKCWGPNCPECGKVAVARLIQGCTNRHALACAPVASWFEDAVHCGMCESDDCFRVEWF